METKAPRVHPQQALAVYAESLASGGRVALFGDSSLGLGERLVDLGARSVEVWDPDARRARVEAEREPEAVSIKAYETAGPRLRNVDLAIVADLGLFDDPAAVLVRARDLVGDDGLLVVAAANGDAPRAEGSRAFEYYELFDLVAAHFASVTMIAELPFHGVALVALGEEGESSGVSVDTQLAGEARVPERFVVVAGQRDVPSPPHTVVELPLSPREDDTGALKAAVRTEVARTEQVEAVLRERDRQVAELSLHIERLEAAVRAAVAHAAAQAADASTAAGGQLDEVSRRAQSAEARATMFERELTQIGEANVAEIRRFEDILKERSHTARSLETELARRDQMVRELVDTLDEREERPAPSALPPPADDGLSEENARLRELLDALALDVARREAEARAAAWTVSELEHRLQKAASSEPAPEGSQGANSR
jgi:hypothetical protein